MNRGSRLQVTGCALAVALLAWAGGCATAKLPTAAEIDSAIAVVAQGVAGGVAAWEQIQALQDAAEEAAATAETEEAEAEPAPVPASADGRAAVAVLGNRETCWHCQALWRPGFEAAAEALLPGCDVVDADKAAAPELYARYRPKAGFSYPLARVFGADGRPRGEFSARGLTAAAFAARVLALCPECAEPAGSSRDDPVAAHVAAVAVGLTRVDPARYGGWGGACPGCDTDARTFALACQGAGVPVKTLIDAQATWPAVLSAVTQAFYGLERGDLMIVYVSGHGGQTAAAGDASETDGRSETLCLYDGPLVDDKVWELVLIARDRGVRVWMITDTCHSGTNYRAAHDYAAAVRGRGAADPDMLHWGGCADGKSSFGTSQGGTFTTALVDAWRSGQSYADWFAGAARRMPQGQRPTCEWTGRDFRHLPAFR